MKSSIENKKFDPKIFFLNLGLLVTLITTVISLIHVLFQVWDKKFPDLLSGVYSYGYYPTNLDSLKTALATLIIFFPSYLVLHYLLHLKSNKNTFSSESTFKKWILYLILFFTSITMVIDISILLRYVISGELTIRFVLKVFSVLSISLLLFLNYRLELSQSIHKIYLKTYVFLFTLLCLITIVLAFSVIGSPKNQRKLQFDQRRLGDLQNIQSQIIGFWQQKHRIPNRLIEIIDPLNTWQSIPQDPEFLRGGMYEYKKINDTQFELCANFSLPIPKGINNLNQAYGPVADLHRENSVDKYIGTQNEVWDHGAGKTCFLRKIDIEKYPPNSL